VELSNEFVVPVGVDEAWGLLTDVERIAPCMPGAELQEIEGDEYRGIVKVKVGPITAQYKGKATFVEKDDGAHKAVLRAEGRSLLLVEQYVERAVGIADYVYILQKGEIVFVGEPSQCASGVVFARYLGASA